MGAILGDNQSQAIESALLYLTHHSDGFAVDDTDHLPLKFGIELESRLGYRQHLTGHAHKTRDQGEPHVEPLSSRHTVALGPWKRAGSECRRF